MKAQLTRPQWLALSVPIRRKLIELFDIPRSASTEVIDGVVASDGHTHEDLAVITLEKVQVLLDSTETDFYSLMMELVKLIEKDLADLEAAEGFTVTPGDEDLADDSKSGEDDGKEPIINAKPKNKYARKTKEQK